MTDKKTKMRESDIDAHLKRAFQRLTEEKIPDRFANLLDKLRTEGPESADLGRGAAAGGGQWEEEQAR